MKTNVPSRYIFIDHCGLPRSAEEICFFETRALSICFFLNESLRAFLGEKFSGLGHCFRYVPTRIKMNAVMRNFDVDTSEAHGPRKWEGLSELDQAIRDNRLMEYRLKKSWADPWGRKLTIIGLIVIGAVFAFLAGASFGLW